MLLLLLLLSLFGSFQAFQSYLKIKMRTSPSVTHSLSMVRETFTITQYDTETTGKPILLYLPGLDGIGNYSIKSVQNLTEIFDLWRLQIDPTDRSSFLDLSSAIHSKIVSFKEPITLMGESFGGLLAMHVALRSKDKVSKLVLINPATSYEQTTWNVLGPMIANAGPAFPLVGLSALLATAVEMKQVQRITNMIASRINSTESAFKELNNLLEVGLRVVALLPPATLQHRLKLWLNYGSGIMRERYDKITCPTLILIGNDDRLLPSAKEGQRLMNSLINTKTELLGFPTGHAILDGSFDLLETLLKSKIFTGKEDNLYDIEYPTDEDIKQVDNNLKFLYDSCSPIFLCYNQNGFLSEDLSNLPTGQSGRPVLYVGNHQLYGQDLPFLIRQFLKEKHTLLRGLAHPLIFSSQGQGNVTNQKDGLISFYQKFGAVPVGGMNYYELLKRNESILLFPGGITEACHQRGEQNQIFW